MIHNDKKPLKINPKFKELRLLSKDTPKQDQNQNLNKSLGNKSKNIFLKKDETQINLMNQISQL